MRKQKKNKTEYYWYIFIAITMSLIFTESYSLIEDLKATKWPTTFGTIDRIYLPGSVPRSRWGPMIEPKINPKIWFSYVVNETQYTSTNKSFGFTFNEDFELVNPDDIMDHRVKVYFNPNNPSEAVLITGPKFINILLIVTGLIFLVVSIKQLIKLMKNA